MSSGKADTWFSTDVPYPTTTPAPAHFPCATHSPWTVHMDAAERGPDNSEAEHIGISQNKSFKWNYVKGPWMYLKQYITIFWFKARSGKQLL